MGIPSKLPTGGPRWRVYGHGSMTAQAKLCTFSLNCRRTTPLNSHLSTTHSLLIRSKYQQLQSYRKISHDVGVGILKDTATILAPEWRHLSPGFGATLPLVTPLKSNLLRYGSVQRKSSQQKHDFMAPGRLARALYFQAQPGAPLQVTRSKSMAAAHVTPPIWGTLLGMGLNQTSSKDFRLALREQYSIKSNHVAGEWTGVSLARWEELKSAWDRNLSSTRVSFADLLSQSLWSMFLWDISTSKRDILEGILALQESSQIAILNPDSPLAQALPHDQSARDEWVKSTLTLKPNDDSITSSAVEQLLQATSCSKTWDSIPTAQSIEMLCALQATSSSYHMKPPSPNGYYALEGGRLKPDCVEVTVREFMDMLLWNEQTGRFDLDRLPSTAHPMLHKLYRPGLNLKEQTQDRGQEWFDTLSNLPDCEYLSSSPSGIPFELTPTMRNFSKVLKRLLVATDTGMDNAAAEWTTLNDVQTFWAKEIASKRSSVPLLHLSLGSLMHRAGMSNDLVAYEVATVGLVGSPMSMDIRLRNDAARNTGFATVTHLRQSSASNRFPEELRHALYQAKRQRVIVSPTLDLLLLLAGPCDDHKVDTSRNNDAIDEMYCRYLGQTTYGLDRRSLMELTATADLEREENAWRQEQRMSDRVLKQALDRVARTMISISDHNKGGKEDCQALLPLLTWLLSENPNIHLYHDDDGENNGGPHHLLSPKRFHDATLEDVLLSLPLEAVLAQSDLQHFLLQNPFVRGSLACTWIDWKSGRASLLPDVVGKLGPLELLAFASRCLR